MVDVDAIADDVSEARALENSAPSHSSTSPPHDSDQARTWQRAAFEYAAELNQAALNTHVRIYDGAGLDELIFNQPAVRSYADAIVELADQHNLRYFRMSGLILRGWAMVQQGAGEEGLALMRRSATERLAMGVSWYQIRYLCMLAEACLLHGSADQGLSAIAEARDLVARTDEHMWGAEVERIEGELRRLQGASTTEVAMRFQAALAIASRQSAKSLELRAAVSLAQLWCNEGGHAKARDLLAPICDWFTEGLDTPDIVAAKSLLETLPR